MVKEVSAFQRELQYTHEVTYVHGYSLRELFVLLNSCLVILMAGSTDTHVNSSLISYELIYSTSCSLIPLI